MHDQRASGSCGAWALEAAVAFHPLSSNSQRFLDQNAMRSNDSHMTRPLIPATTGSRIHHPAFLATNTAARDMRGKCSGNEQPPIDPPP